MSEARSKTLALFRELLEAKEEISREKAAQRLIEHMYDNELASYVALVQPASGYTVENVRNLARSKGLPELEEAAQLVHNNISLTVVTETPRRLRNEHDRGRLWNASIDFLDEMAEQNPETLWIFVATALSFFRQRAQKVGRHDIVGALDDIDRLCRSTEAKIYRPASKITQ